MKRAFVLVAVLFLISGVAWGTEDDFEGGGCKLPDLAGLTPDEIAVAALAAGLEIPAAVPAAIPACPVTFHCDSIPNCGLGACSTPTDIGRCCNNGGLTLCCATGTIKVRQCNCVCTGNPCSTQCIQSTDVRFRCI